MTKKLTKLMLAALTVIGLTVPFTEVQAAPSPEACNMGFVTDVKGAVTLPKDQLDATATLLNLNQTAANKLVDGDDIHYYKFTVTDRGYFNVVFKSDDGNIPNNISHGWDVELYSANDLKNVFIEGERITGNYKSYDIADKGTFYIAVKANSSYFNPEDCIYHIGVEFTKNDLWEIESNNSQQTANVLSLNKEYYATLVNGRDEDWYKITLPANTKLKIKLNPSTNYSADEIGDGWDIELYDSNNKMIQEFTDIVTPFTSITFPFNGGDYYIKVIDSGDCPENCVYGISAITEATGNWELEDNNSSDKANVITVNKKYVGNIHMKGDEDWYKININKNGYFKVQLSAGDVNLVTTKTYGYEYAIYDKDFNKLYSTYGVEGTHCTYELPYKKGTYYIKVKAYIYNEDLSYDEYKLIVNHKETSYWESEGNNTSAKATTIKFGKTYSGLLEDNTFTDVDWFKFTVKKAGAVKITLKANKLDPDKIGDGWRLFVYNKSSSKEYGRLTEVTKGSSITLDLKKGTYYIKIIDEYHSPKSCVYKLKAEYNKAPESTKITSIKSKSKKVTLKWKKVANATGYVIYRSTSKTGTYKAIKTIKKGSTVTYTDKKDLAKGYTYYYKVVAYNTTKGVKANSTASKIKSVKIK